MLSKSSWVRVVVLLALLILTGSTTLARPASQGGTDPSGGGSGPTQPQATTMSRTLLASQQQATAKYWTHERIAAAKSLPIPAQAQSPVAADASAVATTLGPAGFSSPGVPAADADAVAMAAYPEDWANAARSVLAAEPDTAAAELTGTSSMYTSYVANPGGTMQTMLPHRWVGRLLFSTGSGTASCSATSISGNNIVTAAHCVYDTTANRWYSNWSFAPAYLLGSAPYGTFAASTCTILTAYANLSGSYSINAWARYDVAVCTMRANSAGRTLNQAVGYAGREWNYPYARHLHNLGYPARDYNNTLLASSGYLRLCAAESFQQATEVRGAGCSFGPGISGGPWLSGYAPAVTSGRVSGVNSGLYVGQPNLYSGRFNSDNIVPLCSARGC